MAQTLLNVRRVPCSRCLWIATVGRPEHTLKWMPPWSSSSGGRQVRSEPGNRFRHHLAKRWFGIDLVVSEPAQDDQLLGFPCLREQCLRLFGRNEPIIVGRNEEDRTRRDFVDHPFGMKTQRGVDEL